MIINGGSRRAGGWWAKHLENAEHNERVTLAEIVGLDAATIPDLMHEMEILARNSGSRAENYFYQANINPRDHEHLTPAQRHGAKELLLENLGLSGQPHFVVEHEKAGRVHFHVIAFRIDMERGRAISDSLTAQIHERTSRELEIRFDLERGKSVLVPDRDFERPERGAKKSEIFRGAEGGIDPETVKADARLAWERADNGVAFKAALEASGDYVLARGDRRDYLIIDRAGGDHSLARRLGEKAKAVRERMADLDPASLPNAEQAKAMQRSLQADRAMQEARAAEPLPEIERQFMANTARATEPATPIFDRDAANRAADERIIDAAISGPQKARQRQEPEARDAAAQAAQAPPKAERELSGTAADIRMTWSTSRTARELEDGLAARGITLAVMSAEEAQTSQRNEAVAKEIGNFAPPWREREIVAVNDRGHVYRLDKHTTGQSQLDIQGRLNGIDRDALMDVTAAKEAMQAAAREAWKTARAAKREQRRPANWVEQRLADCAYQTGINGALVQVDAERRRVDRIEALADQFRPEAERQTELVRIFGRDAFAARLDDAGLAIARVTEADAKALEALRQDEQLARLAAATNGEAYRGRHFADLLSGELAAVTRSGDVYRVNLDKTGAARSYLPDALPSVTETRAQFEIEREQEGKLWTERRADIQASQQEYAAQQEQRAAARVLSQQSAGLAATAGVAVDQAAHAGEGILRGLGKIFASFINWLADSIAPPPPPTRDQAERMARSAEEKQDARAQHEAHAEREARHWLIVEAQQNAARQREEAAENEQSHARRREQDRSYERER